MRARRDDVNRRTFLRLAAAGVSSAFVPLGQIGCTQKVAQQRASSSAPTPDAPYTRVDDWYYVSIVDPYHADLERYRLKIAGIVDHALSISVPALRTRFENVVEPLTLACVGNPPEGRLVSAGFFRGVRVRDVLEAASFDRDRAEAAIVTGLDGFVALQSMDDLLRPESLFAFDMGPSPDELVPLPVEHGFPLRLMTPGLYGYIQPKWIDSVTIVDERGYHDVLRGAVDYAHGRVQLASGFSRPVEGQTVREGDVAVYGYSYGDGRPIAKVEVRVDGGPWEPAEIVFNTPFDDLPPFLWVLWVFRWHAVRGERTLEARATTTDGATQPEGRVFPYSGGSIAFIPITVIPVPAR